VPRSRPIGTLTCGRETYREHGSHRGPPVRGRSPSNGRAAPGAGRSGSYSRRTGRADRVVRYAPAPGGAGERLLYSARLRLADLGKRV
jgi:hypothetical protein